MPSTEFTHLYQTATVFPFIGYDKFGQPKVGAGQEIKVRWNDTKQETVDSKGNNITLSATVILKEDVKMDSHIWLGTLAQWVAQLQKSDDLCMVKTINKVQDLKNRAAYRTVGVMRLKAVN